MRGLVLIFLLLPLAVRAETPSPEPENAVARLLSWLRNPTGPAPGSPTVSPSPSPAANPILNLIPPQLVRAAPSPIPSPQAQASPAPAGPDPISAILAVKPGSTSTPAAGGTPSAPGSQAPRLKVEFDDSNTRKNEVGKYDSGGSGGGANHRTPPSTVKGAGTTAIPFDKFWPICLFFDPSVGNANQITKDLADMAAKCGVSLVTYPVFIQGFGGSAAALKQKAKEKCNAPDGFGRFGVNRASVVVLTGNSNQALDMCDAQGASPQDIPYCAEMGFDVGDQVEARLRSTGRWGGRANLGESAVAIIGPNGFNAETVAAATGQAQLGLPPGTGAGNGTGEDFEGNAGAGANPERGWSGPGCDRMRETAFDSNGKFKYLPGREFYAVEPKNGKRFDLNGPKNLFARPNTAPAAGPVQAARSGGGGGGGSGGGSVSSARAPASTGGNFSSDMFSSGGHKQAAGGSGGASGGSESAVVSAAGTSRRELEDGTTVRNRLLVPSGQGGEGGETPVEGPTTGRTRPEVGEGTSRVSVEFDDSVRKGDTGTPVGTSEGGLLSLGAQPGADPATGEGATPGAEGGAEGGTVRKPASSLNIFSLFDGTFFGKPKASPEPESAARRRPRTIEQ